MKKLLNRLLSTSLLSLLLIGATGQRAKAQDVDVSYQTFYDELSPYGQWVSDPQYGNVWVPNEGGDFRPYGSRGHWVMTEYGNTWVSDDPWGWACYHYGRWTYDSYYGWVWIPGYEWAPAWVSWRFGGGYSGWAPLGPGMSVGVAVDLPVSWWVFVGPQYMYQPNCMNYWRGPSYNNTYIRQTTIINNYYVDNRTRVRYNYGPRREAIQEVTHQPVQVYRVQQSNRPGSPSVGGNTVSMYRPSVNRGTVGSARPSNVMQAPRQISRPQAATNVAPGRSAPFRQEVQQRQSPQGGGQRPGGQPTDRNQPGNRQSPQPMDRNQPQRSQPMDRPQPTNRPEPQRQSPQPMNRPEPQRQSPQPMNRPEPQRQSPQPMNRPEPQRQSPQPMNRPEPQRQSPQPMNRPEPQRQSPQPMNRPEPQRQSPQPMNRPEPQRQSPQPMNRPEPQRQSPQPMNRPEPQRQSPQPMNRPEQGQPHEGGRR